MKDQRSDETPSVDDGGEVRSKKGEGNEEASEEVEVEVEAEVTMVTLDGVGSDSVGKGRY